MGCLSCSTVPSPVIHRLLSARITRSTVLIVTPEQTRSLEVDTRLLTWLKPLLVGLGASTALLTAGLVGLGAQHLISRADSQQALDAQARDRHAAAGGGQPEELHLVRDQRQAGGAEKIRAHDWRAANLSAGARRQRQTRVHRAAHKAATATWWKWRTRKPTTRCMRTCRASKSPRASNWRPAIRSACSAPPAARPAHTCYEVQRRGERLDPEHFLALGDTDASAPR